jgi:hypothetical protein
MKYIAVLVALSISTICFSQAPTPTPVQNFGSSPRAYVSRQSFWTEFNLNGSISKDSRWQYQIDYQYRRAADAEYIKGGDHGNIFKEAQQQVFRPWVHYWIKPGAVRLSLSPLGYWITWTPTEETALFPNKDQKTTGQTVYPEFRICPQLTTMQTVGRFQFVQRYRYEFRFIGERRAADNNFSDFNKGYNFAPTAIGDQSAAKGWYGHNHAGRLRVQTRVQVPLNHAKMQDKTIYLNVWDEAFFGVGKHIANNKILNQNRFVALLGYRFNGALPIKIEGGVTLQTIFQYNVDTVPWDNTLTYSKANVENNTAYTIYIIFDEFHKLFKKKEKKEEAK